MAARKKMTRRKRVTRKKTAGKKTTRKRASRRRLPDPEWQKAREEIPLGSVPGLPEIPQGPWKPGDGATPEAVEAVFEQMAEGHSVAAMHRRGGYPSPALFWQWADADEGLSKRYARAKEHRGTVLADLAAAHALGLHRKTDTQRSAKGAVMRDRLAADALRWQASKLNRKDYGDKVALEHSGEVARPTKIDLSSLSEDELEKLEELLARAEGSES